MSRDWKSEIPDSHQPRLKLFLSADIVGSTAYKQPLDFSSASAERHTHWFHRVRSFYKTVVEAFAEHTVRWEGAARLGLTASGRDYVGPRPRLWKTVGDEVIMWKELTDWVQLWAMLGAWLQTIDAARTVLKANPMPGFGDLDVKSTAWLAEFPVRNKVVLDTVSVDRNTRRRYNKRLLDFYTWDSLAQRAPPPGLKGATIDFIGSGIDVGFRIGALSTSSRMAVSLDVAYLLAESQKLLTSKNHALFREALEAVFSDIQSGPKEFDFVERLKPLYGGREAMKGVLGGTRYPRFWLATAPRGTLDEEVDNIEAFQSPVARVDWKTLRTFCDRFYSDRCGFISRPFINGDPDFGTAPPRYYEFASEAARRVIDDGGAAAA